MSQATTSSRWGWQLLRFAIVGVVNTLIYYATYLMLIRVMWVLPAHVLGWALAVTCSYLMNARFTYKVSLSWRAYALYPLTSLTTLIVSGAVLVVLVEVFGVSAELAPLIAGLCAVPVTFLVARRIMVPGRAPVTPS